MASSALTGSITQAAALAQLNAYMDASIAIAASQSYEIAGRKLTRADLSHVMEMIKFWDAYVKRLSGTGPRTKYVVFGCE